MVCVVPTVELATSVHGQVVVVYETEASAASSVDSVMVAPPAVTFDTTMLVICGAVASGANGPSGSQTVPFISAALLSFGDSSADATPAPSLKRQ